MSTARLSWLDWLLWLLFGRKLPAARLVLSVTPTPKGNRMSYPYSQKVSVVATAKDVNGKPATLPKALGPDKWSFSGIDGSSDIVDPSGASATVVANSPGTLAVAVNVTGDDGTPLAAGLSLVFDPLPAATIELTATPVGDTPPPPPPDNPAATIELTAKPVA